MAKRSSAQSFLPLIAGALLVVIGGLVVFILWQQLAAHVDELDTKEAEALKSLDIRIGPATTFGDLKRNLSMRNPSNETDCHESGVHYIDCRDVEWGRFITARFLTEEQPLSGLWRAGDTAKPVEDGTLLDQITVDEMFSGTICGERIAEVVESVPSDYSQTKQLCGSQVLVSIHGVVQGRRNIVLSPSR